MFLPAFFVHPQLSVPLGVLLGKGARAAGGGGRPVCKDSRWWGSGGSSAHEACCGA